MGINIKISGSEIHGKAKFLNGGDLSGADVNLSVNDSNFGSDVEVGNNSTNPKIDLTMKNVKVQGPVTVANGATNPNVKTNIRNVTAPEINIPGTPSSPKDDQKASSNTGFDGKPPFTSNVYNEGYTKTTSHPEESHGYNLFEKILRAIGEALDPNKYDKSRDE